MRNWIAISAVGVAMVVMVATGVYGDPAPPGNAAGLSGSFVWPDDDRWPRSAHIRKVGEARKRFAKS